METVVWVKKIGTVRLMTSSKVITFYLMNVYNQDNVYLN